MRTKKVLQAFLTLALLAAVLFIAACGGGTTTEPADTGTPADTATPTPTPDAPEPTEAPEPTAALNRDGILVFGGTGWAGVFNSIMSNNLYDTMVNDLVFEGLISNDAAGNPIPRVATHWEITNNNLTYTFFLDPRATFSDGSPLTAHDVAFTFTTMAHPLYDGPRFGDVQDIIGAVEFRDGLADSVEGIVIIDDHTIQFNHTQTGPQTIWNFGYGILSREYYAFEAWEDFMALIDRPFGSGPFVFVDYMFQQWIEFERNENHWNPDVEINLAGIIMREVPTESIVPALLAGEIHVGEPSVTVDNHAALEGAAHIRDNLFVANTLRHVTFNTLRPHLSDHRVRQALAYAFDTEAYIIADTGSPYLRSVGNSPFSPVSWAFPGVDALNNYDFNMERAHELMDEAGWLMADNGFRYRDGERFSLNWLIYHEAAWPGIITGMAYHTWGELGVELDIQMMDFTTVSDMTTGMPPGEKQFDIFQMGWVMAIDPDLTGGLWDGSDGQNVAGTFFNSGFRDQRLIDLIDQGATEFDHEERIRIYHEIAALTNYYLPVWVLSNGMNLWGFSNDVHNLHNGAFMRWSQAIWQQGTWLE